MKDAGPVGEVHAAGEVPLEQALRRLEEIAGELERGDLDLEGALGLYREARELHAACVARLGEAEHELQILMADGTLRTDETGGVGRAGGAE